MADNENKTENTETKPAVAEAPVVGTNPLTIPWPSDQQGALSELKRGGVTAARRVGGDKEKLRKLMATLRLIADHAKARYVKDAAARKDARVNAVSARARVAEKQARAAEAKAQEYEAAAASVRKNAGVTPVTEQEA